MAGVIPKIGHNGGPRFTEIRPDNSGGWVRIQRNIRTHPVVGFGSLGKYSRAEAWQDLIMECRYEDGKVMNGGVEMDLRVGQMLGAVAWLAQRWHWTPKEVRGFLDKLANYDMIVLIRETTKTGYQKGKQANVISLCNFPEYQFPDFRKGQTEGQMEGKQGANEGQTKGNIYKDNKGTREQGNNLIQSSSKELDMDEREFAPTTFSPSEDGAELSKKMLNQAWKNVDATARQIKGTRTASGKTTGGPLDGSDGVEFKNGKLSVSNGTRLELSTDYPGIDLDFVCTRAAPKLSRIDNPNRTQALSVIHEYAMYAVKDQNKPKSGSTTRQGEDYSDIPEAVRKSLSTLSPERREKVIAGIREKRNA